MKPEKYITDRLENQISWYSSKSAHNQKWFKRFRYTEIVAAALILPLSCFITSHNFVPYAVTLLGLIIVITNGLSSLGKFHENWIEYRTTSETLLHEKFLYLTKTDPYNSANRFSLLVHRCEGIISKENSRWVQTTNKNSNG